MKPPQVTPFLKQMDPYQLEDLFGEFLSRHGWRTEVTRNSRDGGIDVYGWYPRRNPSICVGFDTKRYGDTPITKQNLQTLAEKLSPEYQIDRYCIVATTDTFEAAKTVARDWDIDIVGRRGLTQLLGNLDDLVLCEQYEKSVPVTHSNDATALKQRLKDHGIATDTATCETILSNPQADELVYAIERARQTDDRIAVFEDDLSLLHVSINTQLPYYPFKLSNSYWGGGDAGERPWAVRTRAGKPSPTLKS